jgi:hypothetical protein
LHEIPIDKVVIMSDVIEYPVPDLSFIPHRPLARIVIAIHGACGRLIRSNWLSRPGQLMTV